MAGVMPCRRVLLVVIFYSVSLAATVPAITNARGDVGERRFSDVVPLEKLANFQAECSTRCPFQNKTEVTESSYVGCGVECNIQQTIFLNFLKKLPSREISKQKLDMALPQGHSNAEQLISMPRMEVSPMQSSEVTHLTNETAVTYQARSKHPKKCLHCLSDSTCICVEAGSSCEGTQRKDQCSAKELNENLKREIKSIKSTLHKNRYLIKSYSNTLAAMKYYRHLYELAESNHMKAKNCKEK